MFRNQGPEYYGDFDEADEELAAEEEKASREGKLEESLGVFKLTSRMGSSSSTYSSHPRDLNPINPISRLII
jgi:hypothetical protein